MVPTVSRTDVREQNTRSLYSSLLYATQIIEEVANGLYRDYQSQRHVNMIFPRRRRNFTCSRMQQQQVSGTVIDVCKSWLHTHEDVQIMLASVLIVVGLWWLVRAVLALLINLVCPLLVVILAVVCVPQLRAPLLGQNYPVLANLLRSILLKMAETLKT